VLIVDDEATLARVVAGLLDRLGYAVVAYTSPEDALAAFRATPGRFDAVITDLRMPRMSGLELGGTLLAIRPDVPILLATGFAGELSGAAIRARGFRDLLLKPYSVAELGGALRRALARSR
jgi:CheY-like chemotaxis protein